MTGSLSPTARSKHLSLIDSYKTANKMAKRKDTNRRLSKAKARLGHQNIAERPFCSKSLLLAIVHWLDQLPPGRHSHQYDITSQVYLSGSVLKKSPGFRKATPPETIMTSLPGFSRPPTKTLGIPTEVVTPNANLCRQPNYRRNLEKHGVFLMPSRSSLPRNVEQTGEEIQQASTSGPKPKQIRQFLELRDDLECDAVAECKTRIFFLEFIFPHYFKLGTRGFKLLCFAENAIFGQEAVPTAGPHVAERISTPKPDFAYGYNANHGSVFSESQDIALSRLRPNHGFANATQKLAFPFLVVEFKGSGLNFADVAVNQCLGDSAACVKVINNLNGLFAGYPDINAVNNIAFSFEVNIETAILYVAWSTKGPKYHLRILKRFHLENDYVAFWRCVDNILRWGQERRLPEIRTALDALVEHERKAASEAAKARTPPYDESDSEVSQVEESSEGEEDSDDEDGGDKKSESGGSDDEL